MGDAVSEYQIESIWLEFECWPGPYDEYDANSDVQFRLSDGTEWIATFFTYRNISTICERNKVTDNCLGGLYFCATDMILIERLNRESVLLVIEQMMKDDEISAFCTQVRDNQ